MSEQWALPPAPAPAPAPGWGGLCVLIQDVAKRRKLIVKEGKGNRNEMKQRK